MLPSAHDQRPIEERVPDALATARAAGTTSAALEALRSIAGWRDELAARPGPHDHAPLRRDIAAASLALSELGLSSQPSSFARAGAAVDELRMACRWIDALAIAGDALPEIHACVSQWLARAEQLASPALRALADLLLIDMVVHGHHINHTCRMTTDRLPHLTARCELLWASWASASRTHPIASAALALRTQVLEQRWRYPELLERARTLADANDVTTTEILDWILGSAPLPLGPSDAREQLDGRTGYAHSDPDIVVAALALLDIADDDRFYDLGSGLGTPCLIAALSGHATYRGVELHARYVDRARDNARQLGLYSVEFFVGDVTSFDWSDGTCFYMFNPFPEPVLHVVAERLRSLSALKPIRVACWHNLLPGFTPIASDRWLTVYQPGSAQPPRSR
jgi:SAM-dependent methyltransferase